MLGFYPRNIYTLGILTLVRLDVTKQHIADIKCKISDLKKLERTLSDISSPCAGGHIPECPIINILSA